MVRASVSPVGPPIQAPLRLRTPATVAFQRDCTIVAAADLALPPCLAVLAALRKEPWAGSYRPRGACIGEWKSCLMGCSFKPKLLKDGPWLEEGRRELNSQAQGFSSPGLENSVSALFTH